MKKRTRKHPDDRRDDILKAAVRLAIRHGYSDITRDQIAARANVSTGLVTHYYKTMPQLRRDVVRYAVRNDVSAIILQAMLKKDPHVAKLSSEQKQTALQLLEL